MDGDNPPLTSRRALVTGASRGIGRAIALALADAGADVVVTARSVDDLEEVASEITVRGQRSLVVPCDVTDKKQIRALADTVLNEFGGVDILVNNAGTSGSHKFIDHPDDLWHHMLDLNLTSVYQVTKVFVPAMVAQEWGRIINIASIAGKTGAKYITAYTASKHGVLGLTRALAAELVGKNITVNAICPGYVNTPMTDTSVANIVDRTGMPAEKAREVLENMSPQKRLIAPEEVAALTVYLARDISYGITGQAINIDGGSIMS